MNNRGKETSRKRQQQCSRRTCSCHCVVILDGAACNKVRHQRAAARWVECCYPPGSPTSSRPCSHTPSSNTSSSCICTATYGGWGVLGVEHIVAWQ
jgi:hypothetical protein